MFRSSYPDYNPDQPAEGDEEESDEDELEEPGYELVLPSGTNSISISKPLPKTLTHSAGKCCFLRRYGGPSLAASLLPTELEAGPQTALDRTHARTGSVQGAWVDGNDWSQREEVRQRHPRSTTRAEATLHGARS